MPAAPALPPPVHAPAVGPAVVAVRDAATHTVRAGETLSGIAARYGTTVAALASANGLADPDRIHAGAHLRVPASGGSTPRSTARPSSHVHVVRAGDTLSGIAARYRVPLAGLLKANRLSTTSVIHPGDRVTVRGSASAAASSAAAKKSRRASTTSTVPDSFLGVRYPTSVAEAAARNRRALAERDVPGRSAVRDLVERTARRHGVDPRLALAVAYQESGWNQRAVSPANAVGVMQVIPAGGEWASMLLGRELDLLDAEDNVTAGVVMLRALGRETGDRRSTLAAYYQGLTSLRQHGPYADTTRYVDTVLALRGRM
jgi:LysM repeat protein